MNLPIGSIIIWSGQVASIPDGWQRCDGTNDTPDLSASYVMGASVNSDVGVTGGSNTHTHTIGNTGSGGSLHDHNFSDSLGATGSTGSMITGSDYNAATAGHTHTISNDTGNASWSHTHGTDDAASASGEPPYVRYIFIMRIA